MQDAGGSWLSSFPSVDNLSQPGAAITPRSAGRGPPGSNGPGGGGGGGGGSGGAQAAGILKKRLHGGQTQADKQKGSAARKALITATAIRVMRPDGRTG